MLVFDCKNRQRMSEEARRVGKVLRTRHGKKTNNRQQSLNHRKQKQVNGREGTQ